MWDSVNNKQAIRDMKEGGLTLKSLCRLKAHGYKKQQTTYM